MSQTLHPTLPVGGPSLKSSQQVVVQFLSQFASRQSWLLSLKGFCVALVSLIVGAMILVGLDATGVLSDSWRWFLTCVNYFVALVIGWQGGLNRLHSKLSREQTAQQIELAHPDFRESLLSSIELRLPDGSSRSGSSQFLDAIEQSVALKLNSLDVDSMLPWKGIRQSAITAIGVMALVVGLCSVPGLRFPERWARAMIPFMSLAKPSSIQFVILEPSPMSPTVPSEQIVRFTVEVVGGTPHEAVLELVETGIPLQSENNSHDAQPSNRSLRMNLESENPLRFSLAAPIGNRKTRYRILAGDGESIFRTITPIARPKPLAFHATIQPPEYAQETTFARTDARGDLQVLAGSRVKLQIDVNQSLAEAALSFEASDSGKKYTLPLTKVTVVTELPLATHANSRYSAEFDVTENARYQVGLVSEFEFQGQKIKNSYSPFYKLEAIKDVPATVQWIANDRTLWSEPPKPNSTYIVAADDIVTIAAHVSDNLPVENVSQEISINRGEWLTIRPGINVVPVELGPDQTPPREPSFQATATWRWDLIDVAANSGDVVATRIAVIDRLGQRSLSPVVQLSLASIGFDRERYKSLYRRAELVAPIRALAESLVTHRQQIRPLFDRLRDANLSADQRQEVIREINTMAETAIAKGQAVRSLGQELMPEIARCIDQNEVELAIRSAGRIEKEFLESIRYYCNSGLFQAKPTFEGPYAAWHQQDRDEKWNRMVQCHDLACDHAQRLLDLYRQFIGLELQTNLTKDLTFLMDHQNNGLNRKPTTDFTTLARTHHISEQYMDGIEKLARDMEPNINQDVKDQLGQLYRWIDQTKLETRDLCNEEESDEAFRKLKSRLERSTNELKYVRWAFNLGGNLIWSVAQTRKELLDRSSHLGPNFDNFFAKHNRRRESLNDKSLPSDELLVRMNKLTSDATGPVFTSLGQMLDRRDIHQRRILSDPMFPSDMGMAHRAWTSVLEKWVTDPANADQHFVDLQAIAKAYRVLEAAHETVEARFAVQSLRPLEQFEWKSMDAQLVHPRQWESVGFRLEVAQQWMREAGFPGPVADKYNALRWSEPASKVAAKMNLRRDPNHTAIETAADELQSLLVLWSVADAEAKPTIDEARRVLAKFAPSVSELAQKAAESAERLKKLTEQLQAKEKPSENEPSSDEKKPDAPQQLAASRAEVQAQRDETERKTARLQDALIELAAKQNLLNEAEMAAAQDSDRALKLVDAVTLPMNEALAEAMKATAELSSTDAKPKDVSEAKASAAAKVDEAIKREEKTVKALESVAKHFAMLEKNGNDDLADRERELQQSRAELAKQTEEAAREFSQQPDAIPLRDETDDYKKAEHLAELANSDPESLLKKLEQELQKNQSMQQELSDISKANAQSIATELRNASKSETAMAKQLENSDVKLSGEKRLQLNQLKDVADQAERFAARLLNKAAQSVSRMGAQDQASPLDQQAQKLRQAAESAKRLPDDSTRADIQKELQKLNDQLTQAQTQIESASKAVEPAVEQPKTKDEQQRQNLRNDSQNHQNQIREEMLQQARDALNHAQNIKNAAKQRADEIPAQLNNARKQKQDAKQNLDKNPDNQGAKDWFQNASMAEEQLAARKQAEDQIAKQAEQLAERAQQRLNSFEQAAKANVDRPNPHAALAAEQLGKAKEQVDAIQGQLQTISEASKQFSPPQSPASELAQAQKRQQQLQGDVSEAAKELERSARHEARLGNNSGAKTLDALANEVQKSSDGTVQSAKNELSQANTNAKQAELQQAMQHKDQDISARFDRPSTEPSRDALNRSANDLADKAKQIEGATGKMGTPKSSEGNSAANQQKASDGVPDTQQARDEQAAEAKEMARMLDDLDRQLHPATDPASPNSNVADSNKPSASKENSQANSPSQDSKSAKSSADGNQDRTGAKNSFQESLNASAQKLSGSMNQDRLNQRAAASQAQNNARNESTGRQAKGRKPGRDMAKPEMDSTFLLPGMTRETSREWGKLREQRAEDVVEGRRDEYDPEFSQAIQAYYKAMSTRPEK